MDEFYAWQKKRRKKYLRIFAAVLCLCVVFVTYPDILASLSVLAEGEEDNTIYLSGFCGLPEDVRNQTVLLGTGIDELALPDTLEAVTYVYESSDEEPGEGESKEEDGEPDGSDDGEYDGSEQGDGEDGEVPGEDSGEAEVFPGETEGDGTSGDGSGEENDGSGEGDAEGDDGSDGDSSDSAGEDSGEDSEGEGSSDGSGESGDSGDSGDGEGADSGESSDSTDDISEGSGDSGEDSDEDSDSGDEGSADTMTPQGGAPETKTAAVSGGKATITFGSEFKGTVSVTCTDKAGNESAAKMLGASGGGVLVESHAPQVGFTVNGGAVSDKYYETSPAVKVEVDDGAGGVLSGGIAEVKYKVGNGGTEKDDGQNYTSGIMEKSSFTIPASEIPTGMTQITVKATDNAGNMKTAYVTVKVKGPEAVPNAGLDKTSESLTGLTPNKEYKVSYTDTDGTKKSATVKADGDGKLKLEEAWVDKTVEIVKLGNGTDSTDSGPQSLTIPTRQNTPTGITAEGETGWAKKDGKIVGLIVGTDYEISVGGASWQDVTADTEGEIKNLAPGNYQVRVKADSVTIASKPVICRVAAYVCRHVWDAGKVTKEATEKTPGIRTYTCTICKVTRQETIPAKGGSQNSGGGKDDDKKDENKNDNSGDNGTGGQGSGTGGNGTGTDGSGTGGNGTGTDGSGTGGNGTGTDGNGTGGQDSGIDGTDGSGVGTGSNSGGADGAGAGTDGTDKEGTGSDGGGVAAGSTDKVIDTCKDAIDTGTGIYKNVIDSIISGGSIADGGSGYMIEREIASVDMQKIMTAIGGAQILYGSGKTAAGSEQSAYGSGEAAVGNPQSVYGPDEGEQAGTQSAYDSGKGAAEGTMPTGGASEDTQGGVQSSPGFGKEEGKCSLCHVCPTFFGCCYFAWGAVVGLAAAISFIFHRRWRRNKYKNQT